MFSTVDESRDTGFVEVEMSGQLLHSGFMVSEYSKDSELRDRQPVLCGDPAQYSLNQEGQLDEGVGEPQILHRR